MPGLAGRVRRLESDFNRLRERTDPERQGLVELRVATDAVRAGRATINQYALVDSQEIEVMRRALAGYGVLMTARLRVGMICEGLWAALACVPGTALPRLVEHQLQMLGATVRLRSRPAVGATKQFQSLTTPEEARICARELIALGDDQALPARHRVWINEAGEWKHPAEALAELDRHAISWSDFKIFFGGYFDPSDEFEGCPDDPHSIEWELIDGEVYVAFSEVLRQIELWAVEKPPQEVRSVQSESRSPSDF